MFQVHCGVERNYDMRMMVTKVECITVWKVGMKMAEKCCEGMTDLTSLFTIVC